MARVLAKELRKEQVRLVKIGNALPLRNIPVGKGGELARSAGAYAGIRVPSDKKRLLHINNEDLIKRTGGSALALDKRNIMSGIPAFRAYHPSPKPLSWRAKNGKWVASNENEMNAHFYPRVLAYMAHPTIELGPKNPAHIPSNYFHGGDPYSGQAADAYIDDSPFLSNYLRIVGIAPDFTTHSHQGTPNLGECIQWMDALPCYKVGQKRVCHSKCLKRLK